MAKTADVQQAIWSDPWFLQLPPDGKLLYLWAITTNHGNLAGLFTVAEPMIQFETGLTPVRFGKALEACEGKLHYRSSSGVVWVVGRAKNVRSHTTQIAKSIARTVSDCPEPDFRAAFVDKYGKTAWLAEAFDNLALDVGILEPHPNLTRTSPEVPSMSMSQRLKEEKGVKGEKKGPDPDSLPPGLDRYLAKAARDSMPALTRTAEAKGAKPVTLLAVGRAVEAKPDRDHARVASEVEHWCCFGRGEKRQAKDIVARFRTFLNNSEVVARPTERRLPTPQELP